MLSFTTTFTKKANTVAERLKTNMSAAKAAARSSFAAKKRP